MITILINYPPGDSVASRFLKMPPPISEAMAGREGDLPLPKLERLATGDDATGDDASKGKIHICFSSTLTATAPFDLAREYPARRSVLLFCCGSKTKRIRNGLCGCGVHSKEGGPKVSTRGALPNRCHP